EAGDERSEAEQTRRNPSGISSGRGRCQAVISGRQAAFVLAWGATRLAGLDAGVIFDCDGTLVDSEPLAGAAWRAAVAPYGYEVTEADVAACLGTPYARTHAYFSERAPLPAADAFWPEISRELYALIDTRLEPFD